MKPIFLLLFASAILRAAPVVTEIPWRDACDGATIKITSDESKIVSVRATAVHHALIIQWTIHYIGGTPVSAEFRESERGRISEGEDAGSPSGTNRLKRIKTFQAQDGQFRIKDQPLNNELRDVLSKVTK